MSADFLTHLASRALAPSVKLRPRRSPEASRSALSPLLAADARGVGDPRPPSLATAPSVSALGRSTAPTAMSSLDDGAGNSSTESTDRGELPERRDADERAVSIAESSRRETGEARFGPMHREDDSSPMVVADSAELTVASRAQAMPAHEREPRGAGHSVPLAQRRDSAPGAPGWPPLSAPGSIESTRSRAESESRVAPLAESDPRVESPIVEVRIGRVIVKAPPTPLPAPLPRSAETASRLVSLSDYLKAGGGRR
jgi:hypothetical protein